MCQQWSSHQSQQSLRLMSLVLGNYNCGIILAFSFFLAIIKPPKCKRDHSEGRPYPLSKFKSNRWPAVTLSISYLHPQLQVRPCASVQDQYCSLYNKVDEWSKCITHCLADQPTHTSWCWVSYLSSLRILSISVRSLSVSRCKVAKWCSYMQTTIPRM